MRSSIPRNRGQADHVVVIRLESALLDMETVLKDAFVKCGRWFDNLLDAGEVKLPASARYIDSNGQCFGGFLIKDLDEETPELPHPPREKNFDWPFPRYGTFDRKEVYSPSGTRLRHSVLTSAAIGVEVD